MPYENKEHALGFLLVSVSTAQDAIPIEGALVTVLSIDESGGAQLMYAVTTDRSGRTEMMPLSAPPKANSMTPGQSRPYAVYQVRVDHPQYQSGIAREINLFEDITAELPVYLVSLSAVDGQQNLRTGREGD